MSEPIQPKTVAEQLDAAKTGSEFGAVLSGFMDSLADYTNCSGARADLGDDE
jgi:hypothetical protein